MTRAKGGVAESTTALSVTYLLGRQGKRVLLIDADPQNAITRHFIEGESHRPLRDLMLSQATVSEVTVPAYPGVDLIPSELRLQMIEKELADENNPLFILQDLLLPLDYDLCVIDTPPWMGMMTKSALIAADSVIVPTTLEKSAVEAIREHYASCITKTVIHKAGAQVMPLIISLRKLSDIGLTDKSEKRTIFELEVP